ncbi:hypothetical protein OHU34_14065 [Streptomyces sp. NBC_00080]|nr:hypothetical protein FBY34_3507 [Streptomyces sp. SLBN-115]
MGQGCASASASRVEADTDRIALKMTSRRLEPTLLARGVLAIRGRIER